MKRNKLIKNTLVYFLLMIGYLFIYEIEIDNFFYKQEDIPSTSKVNFIYQQF